MNQYWLSKDYNNCIPMLQSQLSSIYLVTFASIFHYISSNMSTSTPEFILSNKGGRKLLLQGYAYVKKKELKSSTQWECELRRNRAQCKASVWTFEDNILRHSSNEHTHAPDSNLLQSYRINSSIKEKASNTECESSTQRLLSNALVEASDDCAVKMAKTSSIKRRIRRVRQHCRQQPPIPDTADFVVPSEFMHTKKGVEFLLEDGTVEETGKRFLVFATNDNLEMLEDNRHWFVDGTFKSCPENFYQVYTIHWFVNGTTFPCVYALLPDKKQETYCALWTNLKGEVSIQPDSVLMDFEQASINVVSTVFPDTEVKGCFFHFSQSIYRKILDLGQATKYRDDKNFNQAVRMLAALAFVPPEHTVSWYEKLVDSHDDLPQDLRQDYFEDNFIGRINRNGTRRRPRFSIDMWNVYARTVDDLPRTNNSVEGFHRGFESMLQTSKPNVWKFLEAIQRQQTLQEFSYCQMRAGCKIGESRSEDHFTRIKRIVCSAASYTEFNYLKSIAHNLSF